MRRNHEPVTDANRLLSAFGVTLPIGVELGRDGCADAMAPFIVQAECPSSDALGDVRVGTFGLLSASAQEAGMVTQTRHCRVETMKSNPTFRQSWWSGRRCVIPVETLIDWCCAPGQPGMWRIHRADALPMGLAGLWNAWTSPTGSTHFSFCVLTLDGRGHAVFDRLKHPAYETRMPAILPAEAQRQWLHGTGVQAERLLVQLPAEQLHALPPEPASGSARPSWPDATDMFADDGWGPASEPPRKKRPVAKRQPSDLPVPVTGDLFA